MTSRNLKILRDSFIDYVLRHRFAHFDVRPVEPVAAGPLDAKSAVFTIRGNELVTPASHKCIHEIAYSNKTRPAIRFARSARRFAFEDKAFASAAWRFAARAA